MSANTSLTPSVFACLRNIVSMDRKLRGFSDLPAGRAESEIIANHVNALRSCGWTEYNGDVWSLSVHAEVIRDRTGSRVHIERRYLRNGEQVSVATLSRYYNKAAESLKSAERENAYIPASIRIA